MEESNLNQVSMRLLSFLEAFYEFLAKKKTERIFLLLFRQAIDNITNLLSELGDEKNSLYNLRDRHNDLVDHTRRLTEKAVALHMGTKSMSDLYQFLLDIGHAHGMKTNEMFDDKQTEALYRRVLTEMYRAEPHVATETIKDHFTMDEGKSFPRVSVYRWLKSYFDVP